jgi:transcriptional regulator with XRE-family HTH domain
VAEGATPLGELLRRRRTDLGYSRTRAAELSGINASTIEAWEVGRVGKPPIHDVLRLARALSISTAELEQTVMGDRSSAEVPPSPEPAERSGAIPLLERAIAVLGWTDADAAAALNTSAARVGALRRGQGELSVLEVMSLIAVLAAFPSGVGGATEQEVHDLLAQLRRTRA